MNVLPTKLQGVLMLEPRMFRDARGYFLETWQRERYAEAGIDAAFVQDNLSCSRRGVLRGLHFQNPDAQAKLIGVVHGAVWDVAVDLRTGSPTFREWVGVELPGPDARQLYIPEGFAHGFVVLSDVALVSYKCTTPYRPVSEHTVRWDDPELGIEWPIRQPLLSPKDAAAPLLRELPYEHLFASRLPSDE